MNATTTRSRYAVPVAVAVALHAVLFLGFNPTPAPPPPATDPGRIIEVSKSLPPMPVEPLKSEESSDGEEEATPRSDTPLHPPSGPELPPLGPGPEDIVMPLLPPTDGIVDPKMTHVPTTPPAWDEGNRKGRGSISAIDLDEPPRVKFRIPPDYPYAMRTAGIDGTVWVEFTVDETGRVVFPRVTKSTHPDFEEATLRAVSKWVFEKGKRRGHVVRFRMSVPIVFSVGE